MITLFLLLIVPISMCFLSFRVFRDSTLIPRILVVASGFHLICLMLIYKMFELPASDMNIIAAWKELLIIFSLLWLLLLGCEKGTIWKLKFNLLDWAVAAYLLVNVAYIPISFKMKELPVSVAAILNGFRVQSMMLLTYIVARISADYYNKNPRKLLKTMVYFGTFVSIVAIVEMFISPSGLLNVLGMKNYLMNVGGMLPGEFTPDGLVGTYYSNYNSDAGISVIFRRAGSTLLSPVTYCQVLILTVPVALFLSISKSIQKVHFIIQLIGALCSLSRGPILSIFISTLVAVLMIKILPKKLKRVVLVVLIGLSTVMGIKGAEYIHATLTLKDSSAIKRVSVWINSYYFMMQHPFGIGLAASNTKFIGDKGIGGGESGLFENVSRIGWIGIGLYLGLLFIILRRSFRLTSFDDFNLQILSSIVFSATLGLLLQECVNKIWNNPFLPYAYGWILGMWSAYQITNQRAAKPLEYSN